MRFTKKFLKTIIINDRLCNNAYSKGNYELAKKINEKSMVLIGKLGTKADAEREKRDVLARNNEYHKFAKAYYKARKTGKTKGTPPYLYIFY